MSFRNDAFYREGKNSLKQMLDIYNNHNFHHRDDGLSFERKNGWKQMYTQTQHTNIHTKHKITNPNPHTHTITRLKIYESEFGGRGGGAKP